MVQNENIQVKSVTKKTKNIQMVNTDLKCSICNKMNIQFKISKDKIVQMCTCKSREHKLSDKIIGLL